jgi:hypothetical protein
VITLAHNFFSMLHILGCVRQLSLQIRLWVENIATFVSGPNVHKEIAPSTRRFDIRLGGQGRH